MLVNHAPFALRGTDVTCTALTRFFDAALLRAKPDFAEGVEHLSRATRSAAAEPGHCFLLSQKSGRGLGQSPTAPSAQPRRWQETQSMKERLRPIIKMPWSVPCRYQGSVLTSGVHAAPFVIYAPVRLRSRQQLSGIGNLTPHVANQLTHVIACSTRCHEKESNERAIRWPVWPGNSFAEDALITSLGATAAGPSISVRAHAAQVDADRLPSRSWYRLVLSAEDVVQYGYGGQCEKYHCQRNCRNETQVLETQRSSKPAQEEHAKQ
jgi:hypothetical protein